MLLPLQLLLPLPLPLLLYFHDHKPLSFSHKQCYGFYYVVIQEAFAPQYKNPYRSADTSPSEASGPGRSWVAWQTLLGRPTGRSTGFVACSYKFFA